MFAKTLLVILVFSWIAAALFSCSRPKEEDQKTETAEPSATADKGAGSFEVNACSLMTQKEAESIVGEKILAPREDQHMTGENSSAAISLCVFPSESARSITIFHRKSPVADNTPEAVQAVKNRLSTAEGQIQDVTGVGDIAFMTGNQLHVFQGDRDYLVVTIHGFQDEEETGKKAKEAAEMALRDV